MKAKSSQGGMALVVSLVIVSVALMFGVSSFQSSQLEETSAGSQRASASALMAAEFGASERVVNISGPQLASMAFCGGPIALGGFNTLSHEQDSTIGYHFGWCKSPSEGTVTILVKGVAGGFERFVQAKYIMPDGFVLPPINLPGNVSSFEAPDSGRFLVKGLASSTIDGGAYPAITTNGQQTLIEGEISENNMKNYVGGVSDTIGDSVLEDPLMFAIFVMMLKEVAIPVGVIDKDTDLGTVVSPQISYATGSDIKGQNKNNGAGILIVDGDYGTSGTPDFDGLVIVMGDVFDLTGGGKGGVDGSVIAAPMEIKSTYYYDLGDDGVWRIFDSAEQDAANNDVEVSMAYGDISITSSGGGAASFSHNQDYLDMAFDIMPVNAQDFWNFNNISEYSSPRVSEWKELGVDGSEVVGS